MADTLGAIVIADDSETSAAALEAALAGLPGYSVRTTRNGAQAVRLVEGSTEPVVAVITDLHMPGMDGFELIRRLRALPAFAGRPIVVVSADPDPASPERAMGLGANAYFSKPCSPLAVRRRLEQLLDETTG